MARLTQAQLQQRDREIAASTDGTRALAERYGLSESHVYRIRRREDARAESFGYNAEAEIRPNLNLESGLIFKEYGLPGLRNFNGEVYEDYDKAFKPLRRKIALFREMGDDPTVAAVLQAVKMQLRGIAWYVDPGGQTAADEAAAKFLESCMEDMSQSWMDTIERALDMIQFGFSVAELTYKRRLGLTPGPVSQDDPVSGLPETVPAPASKYFDGRIGWRKWQFIGQDTLSPGSPWIFDNHGGIKGLRQQPPPVYINVQLPIEKLILFRTMTEKNNPEGRSLLRAMYPAWYFKKNLEEIEAISAERMGAGLPVIYAGRDVGKSSDANSDIEKLKGVVRNVRVDEQMGVVIPFAKMGGGANPGEGVLFELLAPPNASMDFDRMIQRYEKRMAMVGLAQFIHLGMDRVGTQALASAAMDFFTLSIQAWADLIEETIHRYATERLFRLNYFDDITDWPRIKHEAVAQKSLTEFADALNKLVGSGVLTTGPEIETYVRELADLPSKPDEAPATTDEIAPESGTNDVAPQAPDTSQMTNDMAMLSKADTTAESFAATRGARPGGQTKQLQAVNAYEQDLLDIYDGWSDDLVKRLLQADEDERDSLIGDAVGALLLLLMNAGRGELFNALTLALGGQPPTPDMIGELNDAITENDGYLRDSLIPAIEGKLRAALGDKDIMAALKAGGSLARDALGGVLDTLNARVASYAGAWWALFQHVVGHSAQAQSRKVIWYLDPAAQHCADCPRFGTPEGKEYDSYEDMLRITGGKSPADGVECGPHCRCGLGLGDYVEVSGIPQG